jgi:hypothetical protein
MAMAGWLALRLTISGIVGTDTVRDKKPKAGADDQQEDVLVAAGSRGLGQQGVHRFGLCSESVRV